MRLWYQAPAAATLHTPQAYDAVLKHIPYFEEYVFCDATDTINIVFSDSLLLQFPYLNQLLQDAGFKRLEIPRGFDPEAQAELNEAVIKGSNFNKKWV